MTRDDNKSSQQWFGGCALYRTVTGNLHMGISQKWLGGGPGGPSLTRSGYRMDGVSIGAMWATVTGCGMEPEPDGMGWGMGKSGEMSKSQFARRASHASACGMWVWIVDVDARTASLLRVVLAWPVRRPAAAAAVRASAVQKCPPHHPPVSYSGAGAKAKPPRHATKPVQFPSSSHNVTKRPEDTHSRAHECAPHNKN